jgi:hypothetical protein
MRVSSMRVVSWVDAQDFAFTATFLGEKLHVQRLGTDGSTARAVALVRQWDSKADAIGLGVLKDRYRAGSHRFVEKDSAKLKAVAKQALTTIGGRLGDILQEWSVRHAQIQLGNYFNNARVVFLSGMTNYKLAMSMAEYTDNVMFADPLLQLGVPKFLTSIEALQLYSTGAHYVKDWSLPVDLATGPIKEWTRFVLRKAVQKATVLVARRMSSTSSGWRNWPARPSSPPPSTTSASPSSRTRACTW